MCNTPKPPLEGGLWGRALRPPPAPPGRLRSPARPLPAPNPAETSCLWGQPRLSSVSPPPPGSAEPSGGWRGGSSPAPPSPGFPRAKAIKRVIRLLKTDVNNGEEAAVTGVPRGRCPPGMRKGTHSARPEALRGVPAAPAAGGPRQFRRELITHQRGPVAPGTSTVCGARARAEGMRWGNCCKYQQPFKLPCSPANPPAGALSGLSHRLLSRRCFPHPTVPRTHGHSGNFSQKSGV